MRFLVLVWDYELGDLIEERRFESELQAFSYARNVGQGNVRALVAIDDVTYITEASQLGTSGNE